MIIVSKHDFGFVHIAKCAGSTIRQQLREHDDLEGRLSRTHQIEGYGKLNCSHLPLQVLGEIFPEDLQALRRVTSYTICREPLDRFASGIAQRLRGTLGREPGEMKQSEIMHETENVMAHLEAHRGDLTNGYVLFAPQIGYVELDGETVVSNVVPIERMDVLFDAIEHKHKLPIQRDTVWNPTVTYRNPRLTDPLNRLKKYARKHLPVSQYSKLRDIGVRVFTKKGVPRLEEAIKGSERIKAFVQSYYAADIALHRRAVEATSDTVSDSASSAGS